MDIRMGAVSTTASGSPSTCGVTLEGATTAVRARYLSSYTPTVSDTVAVAVISGTYLVLGKQA